MAEEPTDTLAADIVREYGERGEKAIRLIREGRIKKYLDFYVVVGDRGEYVVEDNFCTCNDFLYRGRDCTHIIAVRIAEKLGCVEKVDEWYQDYL